MTTDETNSPPRGNTVPLVAALHELAQPTTGKPDLGALAELRGAASDDPTRTMRAYKHVLPWLSATASPQELDDAVLFGSLFASHFPRGGRKYSLGRALRRVKDKTESGSVDLRVDALLGAERGDLAPLLRRLVALCRSKEIELDWQDVWWVIRGWRHPLFFQQKRIARDYWGTPSERSEDEANSTDDETQRDDGRAAR